MTYHRLLNMGGLWSLNCDYTMGCTNATMTCVCNLCFSLTDCCDFVLSFIFVSGFICYYDSFGFEWLG